MSAGEDMKALAQRWRSRAEEEHLGYSERFEREAEAFYRATRHMAPGKSAPLEMYISEQYQDEREAAWREWQERRKARFYSDVRATADALERLSAERPLISIEQAEVEIAQRIYEIIDSEDFTPDSATDIRRAIHAGIQRARPLPPQGFTPSQREQVRGLMLKAWNEGCVAGERFELLRWEHGQGPRRKVCDETAANDVDSLLAQEVKHGE